MNWLLRNLREYRSQQQSATRWRVGAGKPLTQAEMDALRRLREARRER